MSSSFTRIEGLHQKHSFGWCSLEICINIHKYQCKTNAQTFSNMEVTIVCTVQEILNVIVKGFEIGPHQEDVERIFILTRKYLHRRKSVKHDIKQVL